MRHILHPFPVRNLPQLRHQQLGIPLNQPCQIPRRRIRKRRPKQSPNPSMMRVVAEDDVLVQTLAVIDGVAVRILAVLHAAGLQAVNVLPRLGLGEG